MKLLPKKIVNSLVEDQRKIQIDEGIMLARKVDALREKLADLQQQHSLFVMSMEDNLKARTQKLFEIIQEKETEIKLLEIKRQELLKPLDDAWYKVKTTQSALEANQLNVDRKLHEVRHKEEGILKKNDEARETLNHIKVRERELERTFDKAEQLKIEAEKKFIKISSDKEKQDEAYYKLNKELIIREQGIKSYEFTLKQRREQIEMREEENKAEKIRLLDMRSTLERGLARIKNK